MRLVYLGIGWVTGIILASQLPMIAPIVWLVMLGLTVTFASLMRDTAYFWWIAAVAALAFGAFRYGIVPQSSDLAQYNEIGGATIEGVIIDEPDIRDDRVQVRLSAETIQFGAEIRETSGLILVNAPRVTNVAYGDRIRVTGEMSTPAVYDTFSYADFLARQGVFSLMDRAIIEVVDRNQANPAFEALFRFKSHLERIIADALPAPESALLTGILLGDERGIDPNLQEDFTRVGASHVIAISGFNMAIIAGLVMGILEKPFRNRKWIATLIGIVVLAIYTLLVGANAAVVRAAIMSSLLVIAPQLNRRSFVPASLAFVAIAMSFQNPLVLWDLSFQLSFFAVLGLVLFTEPLERQFDRLLQSILPQGLVAPVSGFLNEPIVVSVAALIMTIPLIILYFGRLSLVSLLVNLLIVPVQALVLLVGGFAVLLGLVSPMAAQVFFWLDMILLRWTIGVVRFFGDFTYADIEISLSGYWIWGFFLMVIGGAIVNATRPAWADKLGYWLQRNPILPTTGLMAVGLLILLFNIFMSRPDGQLHVWFLDVGHSNAILMQTANGSQILVDGGRFPSRLLTSIGDRVPFYDREIEVVIITQPDEFDLGALPSVLRRYDAGVVLTNGLQDYTSRAATVDEIDNNILNLGDSFTTIQQLVLEKDIRVIPALAGYTIDFGDGTQIEVTHPQIEPSLGDSFEDISVVVRVVYEDFSMLLTSDIGIDTQYQLLEGDLQLKSTVLQIPQHGTERSLIQEFVERVDPQVAVIQSDIANRRGDPASSTLSLIEDIPLFRTDMGGVIHLKTDGQTISVSQDE